ncbi:hypothetical protein C1H46_014005 [Malus baccata]|uniref:Uncharacterized protein n=1 Tax=Malus baccata TaxID=106549 RepID=A0A540MNL3_MALBA|nr:hypothetical protein C1H46_014005 [Malus baccata]
MNMKLKVVFFLQPQTKTGSSFNQFLGIKGAYQETWAPKFSYTQKHIEAITFIKGCWKSHLPSTVEGQLKNEIMSKPDLFVTPHPELPLALLDEMTIELPTTVQLSKH